MLVLCVLSTNKDYVQVVSLLMNTYTFHCGRTMGILVYIIVVLPPCDYSTVFLLFLLF